MSTDAELASTLRTLSEPLLDVLGEHAPRARAHSEASAAYAFALAAELDLDRDRCEVLRGLAMLHEIGQLYVPDAVLAKPAAERDAAEAATFDAHYEAGARMAEGAGAGTAVGELLLRQRERFDGNGPDGLAGELIPIESRVIRAACACETALSASGIGRIHDRAIVRLGAVAGSELDPRIVAALIAVLERAGQAARADAETETVTQADRT